MGKKMARKRRAFSDEFKAETVKLVRDSGKGVGAIARELDLTETALRRWVEQAEIDAGRGAAGALTTSEHEELVRLRRENRRLQMERDILKNYLGWRPPTCWPETLGSVGIAQIREERPSAFWRSVDPVKKRGPGNAADLAVVTLASDPV